MEVEITKRFECDVLVVGGGVAGYGAAVGAARSGAKVILAEANGYLGGCATAGLIAPSRARPAYPQKTFPTPTSKKCFSTKAPTSAESELTGIKRILFPA